MSTVTIPDVRYAYAYSDDKAYKVAYHSWGPEQNASAVIFCVHGLTGNATNFAYFANYVQKTRPGVRVISLDLPGRGKSDWFDDRTNYNYSEYARSVMAVYNSVFSYSSHTSPCPTSTLPKRLYVGTSLGGLIAMFLASKKSPAVPSLFDAYCFNDIGPIIPAAAISAVKGFTGVDPHFDSEQEAVTFVRDRNKIQWGPTTNDEFWAFVVRQALVAANPVPNVTPQAEATAKAAGFKTHGKLHFSYDIHGIGAQMDYNIAEDGSLNILQHYSKIVEPILLLQGEISYLCPDSVVAVMKELSEKKQGPPLTVELFERTGHVIPLYTDAENERVMTWFDAKM